MLVGRGHSDCMQIANYLMYCTMLHMHCSACKLGGDRALLLRGQVPSLLPGHRAAKKLFNVINVARKLQEMPVVKVTCMLVCYGEKLHGIGHQVAQMYFQCGKCDTKFTRNAC